MIEGFDTWTDSLTHKELVLVPTLVQGFESHRGKEHSITATQILQRLRSSNYDITGAQLIKLINYIRLSDLMPCLISDEAGYYVAANHAEMDQYLKSIQKKIEKLQVIREQLVQQRRDSFGQTTIFN